MLLAAADVPTMLVMIILSSLVTAGGMAVVGYSSAPLQAWERLLIYAAGASLVIPASVFSYDLLGLYNVTTDEIGFLVAVAVIAQHMLRARRQLLMAAA